MKKFKDEGNLAKTVQQMTGQKPEVREDGDVNYAMNRVEKLYNLIRPYQQIVSTSNGLVEFNSTENIQDDAFWIQLTDIYSNSSPTFSNLIDLRRNMLTQKGLSPVVPQTDPLYQPTIDFLNKENDFGDSMQDIWLKLCFDYSLMETYFLEVLYNSNGKIESVIHQQPNYCRAQANTNTNLTNVHVWELSARFGETNKGGRYVQRALRGIPIPNFNTSSWATDGARQLLNCKRYTSGNNYYSIPSFASILPYCSLQLQLATFSLSTVSKGFTPTSIVVLNGNPDKKAKDEFTNRFRQRYSGADGEKILFIWTTDENSHPEILPFNNQDITPMIESLQRISIESIASGLGAPIELVAAAGGNSLQTDMNKLKVAHDFYLHSRIKPMINEMLRTLNRIFRHNGLSDVKVDVEPLTLEEAQPQNKVVETQPIN